jgi:hypothetical protein
MRNVTWLACLTFLGCGGPDAVGAVEARLYALQPDGGYGYTTRRIHDVVSIAQLRSSHVVFRASSDLELGFSGTHLDRGQPFDLAFHLEDGVVVADDDRSLDALSAFANLNACATLFSRLGAVSGPPMDVLFHPRMDSLLLGDLRVSLTDNAAYAGVYDAFIIIPSFVLRALPLEDNLGVMCHEFGHSIMAHQAFGAGDGELASKLDSDHSYRAMEEGVADLFGYAATGAPNFIAPSVSQAGVIEDRDLSQPLTYSKDERRALVMASDDDFSPHHHGSYLARAIYEALPREPDGRISTETRWAMATALIQAIDSHPFNEQDSMARFANAYLKQLGDAERARACEVLTLRLDPLTHLVAFEACS